MIKAKREIYKSRVTSAEEDRKAAQNHGLHPNPETSHEHRVWTVKGDGRNCTAVISEYEGTTPYRVSFVMHHDKHEAVIIDNGQWDLLCFDLDYDRNEVWVACENYLDWVKRDHDLYSCDNYEFKDYDDLMAVLS